MKTPVLIAAHNEEERIDRALAHLPASSVEPFVIANGCTDNTVNIAIQEKYGATVIELEQPGKLPALQHGLKFLGTRALEPVLLLDGDSFPLRPAHWAKSMTSGLATDRPSVVSGPIIYNEAGFFDASLRSIKRYTDGIQARRSKRTIAFGANMAINAHDPNTLARLLDMPHYWEYDDQALRDEVVGDDEGASHQLQRLSLNAAVVTSSRSMMPLVKKLSLLLKSEDVSQHIRESYAVRAPLGSVPYAGKEAAPSPPNL